MAKCEVIQDIYRLKVMREVVRQTQIFCSFLLYKNIFIVRLEN